jgi:hypothetical protein
MKDNHKAADLLLNADIKTISKALQVPVTTVTKEDVTEDVYYDFGVLEFYSPMEIDMEFVNASNERQNFVRYRMELINGGKKDD